MFRGLRVVSASIRSYCYSYGKRNTYCTDGWTDLKIERGRRSSGQVLRFTVLLPTTRIVGVAEIQIPLMEGYSLADKVGEAEAKSIEEDLQALAVRVADAVQSSVSKAS